MNKSVNVEWEEYVEHENLVMKNMNNVVYEQE
jgi:hypothetical protein